MAQSVTDIAAILKQLFPDGLDTRLVMKDHVWLAMMPRWREFYGENVKIPLRYGKPQGRSHTFPNARKKEDTTTDKQNSLYAKFVIDSVPDYGTARISGRVVRRAMGGGSESQFIDALEAEMTGALETLGDNLAKEAYGNAGGNRGTIGSISTDTITLANTEDIVFWEIGMEFALSANDGTDAAHTLRDSGDTLEVIAIDEDLGTIQADANISTISGATAGDYIFAAGDFKLAATGLASYIPSTAPSSGDDLHGLDRSTSPQRLAGIRFTGTAYDMDEVWIKAQARGRRSGVKLSHFLCNPEDYANVELALESRKRIVEVPSEYDGIGFEGLAVTSGGQGAVPLLADPDCPRGVSYGVELDTWTWGTQGEAPTVIDEDGLEFVRDTDADTYECRQTAEHNFWTNAPGRNMRISLPTS